MTAPAPTRRYPDHVIGPVMVCVLGLLALGWAGHAAARVRPPSEPSDQPLGFFIGLAVGLLAAVGYWQGFRATGLIPIGLTLTAAGLLWSGFTGTLPVGVAAVAAGGTGLVLGAAGRYIFRGLRHRPVFDHPYWPRSGLLVCLVPVAALLAVLLWAGLDPDGYQAAYPWAALAGWGLLLGFAWVRLFRPFWELGTEPILWTFCDVRCTGPGLDRIPYAGPLVVMANHACFWDPLFLAKAVPRPITPMMTAGFFDLWFLRPLMVYVFRVIRVRDVPFRRELPEVAEAIAALDRGECLVIFPEGYLRRKEEVPLRRFGRGLWEILRARPDTPVVAAWIEGGWGSWVSHRFGPPTKNKPFDIRRPIGVGLSAPVVLKAEVLADQMRTRIHLMNEVLAARAHLGLPALPPVELPTREDDEPVA